MTLVRLNRGKNHSYKLDGKPVQGVTTLISKGMPKPAMPYWSARTVAEFVADTPTDVLCAYRQLGRDGMVKVLKDVPWTRRDEAAARGTEVHALADLLARGERVDVPDHIAGHVESAVRFLDDWRIAPVLTETLVGSRAHWYAGTLDVVADLPDGRRAILDYKTSASGIWPETALQLAAYRLAEFYIGPDGREMWMADVGINCAYAVWLRSDGYDVIPVNTGPEVFEMFRAVAYVARRMDGMKEWIGEAERWDAAVAA